MTMAANLVEETCVPAHLIRNVLKKWMEKAAGDYHNTGSADDPMAPSHRLAYLIWPDSSEAPRQRRFRAIMNQQESISFDLADHILCALHMSHLWREDPELAKVYQRVNLRALDYRFPTCDAVKEFHKKKVLSVYVETANKEITAERLGIGVRTVQRILEGTTLSRRKGDVGVFRASPDGVAA